MATLNRGDAIYVVAPNGVERRAFLGSAIAELGDTVDIFTVTFPGGVATLTPFTGIPYCQAPGVGGPPYWHL